MQGYVENLTAEGVSGWAWDPTRPAETLAVDVTLDEKVIGEAKANIFRPDLRRAGVGEGTHGFAIAFPEQVSALDLLRVAVRPRESRTNLPLLGPLRERLRSRVSEAASANTDQSGRHVEEAWLTGSAPLLFSKLSDFQAALVSLAPDDRVRLIKAAVAGRRDTLGGVVNVAYLRDTDPDSFEAALEEVGKHAPDHLIAMRALAWHHNRAGSFSVAAEVLSRLLQARPTSGGDARRERLRLRLLCGDLDAEQWDAETAKIETRWRTPASLCSYDLQRQVALGAEAELDAARGRLDAAIDAHPGGLLEVARAGQTQAARGRYAAALARILSADRVALVGNAPSLRDGEFGAEIDAHDCVIRVNFPVVAGFERHIGMRTDVVLFSETYRDGLDGMLARHAAYADVPAFGVIPESPPPQSAASLPHPDIPSMPEPLCELLASLTYSRSTTGLMAITLLSMVLRKSVSLYGFNFFEPGREAHYFGAANIFLGHEAAYERWFVRVMLDRLLPNLRFVETPKVR